MSEVVKKFVVWLLKSNSISRNFIARLYWQRRISDEIWLLKKRLAVDIKLNCWTGNIYKANSERLKVIRQLSRLKEKQKNLSFFWEHKELLETNP